MFSPRVNQSVPKLNVPKKLRVPNSSASVPNGPPRSAKGIFRQWGDPPPPPLARSRPTEQRTQSLPSVKRRPGSADPRFRRRLDKTNSNLTIDPSNTSLIGDCKKTTITHCKSESVTPRKINGEGEISEICKRTDVTKDLLEKTIETLAPEDISKKINVADKTEPHLPTAEQPKQVEQPIITEPEKVTTKLTDYETPSMSFIYDKVVEPVCKVDTPKCADENLESKFHDHMFFSTLQTKFEPSFEKEKLSGSDIEDDAYEKFLRERIKLCTSHSFMTMPLYSVKTEFTKHVDTDEEGDVTCNSNKVRLQAVSKKRDLTLICGSAVIFGASVWYFFGPHIDMDELSKTIPWLQPEPEPSVFDYFTSAAGFLLESCVSVVSFVFNILTVSLEEEME